MTDIISELLRSSQRTPPSDFAAVCDRLAARAASQQLLDVTIAEHETPLGTLLLAASEIGLVRVALPNEEADAVSEELAQRISPRLLAARSPLLERARRQLDEYFASRRQHFDLPLDWRLTKGFRQQVLICAEQIPYGQTRSYRELAALAERPAAVRATGTALATNPLPLIVPCHRVLRSDGSLGGYRGGVAAKQQLLDFEAQHAPSDG